MSISSQITPEPEQPVVPVIEVEAPKEADQPSPTVTTQPVEPAPVKSQYEQITDALLKSIGDIGAKSKFKILIYGDPGTGKSTFLGTSPNNLIYSFEDGLVSINTASRPKAENVQEIPFKSNYQAEVLMERLLANDPAFDKWSTFSVDTLSDYHKRTLSEITEREWQKQPSRNRYVPVTEDYVEANRKMENLARQLRDLDRDIIVLAHAKTVEPKNKPAKIYPDFSESLANKIEAMMDIVGYMSMQEVDGKLVPVLRVTTEGTIHAKTRVPLPPEIIDPTFPQLKEIWMKHCA